MADIIVLSMITEVELEFEYPVQRALKASIKRFRVELPSSVNATFRKG